MFSLQVLGAVAQLERALIAERTKAGIKAAKARGKLPGNPGLRERKPEAIRAVSQARNKRYLDELITSARTWLPLVQQMRPVHSWENIVQVLNRRGHDWTVERLRRAVHRLVREKIADKKLLARSHRRIPSDHLMKLVAAIAIADPGLSLRDIAAQLDQMGERPARGGRNWQPPFVIYWMKPIVLASFVAKRLTDHPAEKTALPCLDVTEFHRAPPRKLLMARD